MTNWSSLLKINLKLKLNKPFEALILVQTQILTNFKNNYKYENGTILL